MKEINIGPSFDSWLRGRRDLRGTSTAVIKRVLAREIEAAVEEKQVSKTETTRRMPTNHAALDRLFDPDYDAAT